MRSLQTDVPLGSERSSGSAVRLPVTTTRLMLTWLMWCPSWWGWWAETSPDRTALRCHPRVSQCAAFHPGGPPAQALDHARVPSSGPRAPSASARSRVAVLAYRCAQCVLHPPAQLREVAAARGEAVHLGGQV